MVNSLNSVKIFYQENKRRVLKITIALGILFVMIFSDFGYITTIQLLIKNAELRSEIDLFKQKNDSLKRRITILKSDSTEIERIAREHFGMIKADEEVFIED